MSKLVVPSHFHEATYGSDRGDPRFDARQYSGTQNVLPPQFLFPGPTLFRLQNLSQALAIAASLKSLIPGRSLNIFGRASRAKDWGR
jgi:hypothetical protein